MIMAAAASPTTMANDPCEYPGDVAPDLRNMELCAWTMLAEGADGEGSGFRTGTFCSTDERGYPTGRTMTLRHVDEAARRVVAYTDLRTAKVTDIAGNARTSWVFYDPRRGVQVRIGGEARVRRAADDPAVRAAWDRLAVAERRCYLVSDNTTTVPSDPGHDLDTGADPLSYTRAGTEAGLANFGLVVMDVLALDIMLVGVLENTSARVLYAPDGAARREWRTPNGGL